MYTVWYTDGSVEENTHSHIICIRNEHLQGKSAHTTPSPLLYPEALLSFKIYAKSRTQNLKYDSTFRINLKERSAMFDFLTCWPAGDIKYAIMEIAFMF